MLARGWHRSNPHLIGTRLSRSPALSPCLATADTDGDTPVVVDITHLPDHVCGHRGVVQLSSLPTFRLSGYASYSGLEDKFRGPLTPSCP